MTQPRQRTFDDVIRDQDRTFDDVIRDQDRPDLTTLEGRVLADERVNPRDPLPTASNPLPSLLSRAGDLSARLGTRGIEVPGLTPALRRGTDEVFKTFEAFSEGLFQNLTRIPNKEDVLGFRDPLTGRRELSEEFRERPFLQQLGVGLIDPTIVIGGPKSATGRGIVTGSKAFGEAAPVTVRQLSPDQVSSILRPQGSGGPLVPQVDVPRVISPVGGPEIRQLSPNEIPPSLHPAPVGPPIRAVQDANFRPDFPQQLSSDVEPPGGFPRRTDPAGILESNQQLARAGRVRGEAAESLLREARVGPEEAFDVIARETEELQGGLAVANRVPAQQAASRAETLKLIPSTQGSPVADLPRPVTSLGATQGSFFNEALSGVEQIGGREGTFPGFATPPPGKTAAQRQAEVSAERLRLAADPAGPPSGPPPKDPRFQPGALEQPKLPGFPTESRNIPRSLLNGITEFAILLRSLGGSGELSGVLRQGGPLSIAHPKEALTALSKSVKSVFSEQNARGFEAARRADPYFVPSENAGLHFSTRGAGALKNEELFLSNWARRIPGLSQFFSASERAFTTFLNELRFGTMKTVLESWQAAGKTVTESDTRNIAKFFNHATGRGDLGVLEKIAPQLNAVFWAPRLAISYPQLLIDMFRPGTSRLVRQQIWRDLAISVGTGGGILAILNNTPGANVTTDPRSSDFGKVEIGGTRYNFWGGAQTTARSFTQSVTGKVKPLDNDQVYGRAWEKTVRNFFRFKMAPLAGLAVDVAPALPIIPGEPSDPIGRPIGTSPRELTGVAFRKLLPLFYQDMIEAAREEGFLGGVQTTPGFFGIGVQTFKTPLEKFAESRGITTPIQELSDAQQQSLLNGMWREEQRKKELNSR